mgnify:CR=1 FL=1
MPVSILAICLSVLVMRSMDDDIKPISLLTSLGVEVGDVLGMVCTSLGMPF